MSTILIGTLFDKIDDIYEALGMLLLWIFFFEYLKLLPE